MNIDYLIDQYLTAKTKEDALRDASNAKYNLGDYYSAITETNKVLFSMINHPGFTIELQDKYYPRNRFDIPYPVSC